MGQRLKPILYPFLADLTRVGLGRNTTETIDQKAFPLKLFVSATFRQSEPPDAPLEC